MQPEIDNLFAALYRWVEKHDENYLSESLALVIRRLLLHSPGPGSNLVSLITEGKIRVDSAEASRATVLAQRYTQTHGIPDIWIALPSADVAIEVKVDAPLGRDQLAAYRQELDHQGKPNRCLVFLSRLPAGDEASQADVSIRWFQLAEALSNFIGGTKVDPVTEYLVSQFLDYLKFRMLALSPVRSAVSQAVRQYYADYPDGGVLATRIRNLENVNDFPTLQPLVDLLALMKSAVQTADLDASPILDSGQSPAPWIGYNIKRMKYFFYLFLSKPEEVVLETSVRFAPSSETAIATEASPRTSTRPHLERSRDLADPSLSFFDRSSESQLDLLANFLRDSDDQFSRL
jgi:hypothetical protein